MLLRRLNASELGKKVGPLGMKPRQSSSCKRLGSWMDADAYTYSRTYDDEDEGKVVRQGFEPGKFNPVTNSDFAVGDDDDEPQNVGKMQEESEEARRWASGRAEDEERSVPEASTNHGSLDDRHVWNAKDGDNS